MKFEKVYAIRIFECGVDTKLNFSSILNYMQDIAADHTVKLKITIFDLFKRKLTWMLSRYHISVERYPVYMEKVIIKTWIPKHEGMFSIRDFTMESETGEIIARMTSSWVLYNFEINKIVNVAEALPLSDYILNERAIDDPFPSLTLPESVDHSLNFTVRKFDLDINRHVNNRVSVEWGIESVPNEISSNYMLVDSQITYKGQAFYGDQIESQCQVIQDKDSCQILHHVINKKSGKSIIRMHTKWLKKGIEKS